ncbi:MAG: DUF3108 domain-containing protein [Myxococcota bacterium]|nr:DUF3108 domain-containing protein [Myxococcota bacterium]
MTSKSLVILIGTTSLILLAQLSVAGGKRGPTAEVLHYELQALGGPAGEAALTMGAARKVKGKRLRPIRLESRTVGMAGRVYPFVGGGTTWIDDQDLPIRIRWDSDTPLGRRTVSANTNGKRLHGEYKRGTIHKRVKRDLDQRPTDLVSAVAWLASRPLKPGDTLKIPVFLGMRVYDMVATVGEADTIHLPVGIREAVPVRIVATNGKRRYDAEVWYTTSDHTPALLRVRIRGLGLFEARLSRRGPVATGPKRP